MSVAAIPSFASTDCEVILDLRISHPSGKVFLEIIPLSTHHDTIKFVYATITDIQVQIKQAETSGKNGMSYANASFQKLLGELIRKDDLSPKQRVNRRICDVLGSETISEIVTVCKHVRENELKKLKSLKTSEVITLDLSKCMQLRQEHGLSIQTAIILQTMQHQFGIPHEVRTRLNPFIKALENIYLKKNE